jgi:hypothetical protein
MRALDHEEYSGLDVMSRIAAPVSTEAASDLVADVQ